MRPFGPGIHCAYKSGDSRPLGKQANEVPFAHMLSALGFGHSDSEDA